MQLGSVLPAEVHTRLACPAALCCQNCANCALEPGDRRTGPYARHPCTKKTGERGHSRAPERAHTPVPYRAQHEAPVPLWECHPRNPLERSSLSHTDTCNQCMLHRHEPLRSHHAVTLSGMQATCDWLQLWCCTSVRAWHSAWSPIVHSCCTRLRLRPQHYRQSCQQSVVCSNRIARPRRGVHSWRAAEGSTTLKGAAADLAAAGRSRVQETLCLTAAPLRGCPRRLQRPRPQAAAGFPRTLRPTAAPPHGCPRRLRWTRPPPQECPSDRVPQTLHPTAPPPRRCPRRLRRARPRGRR